MNCAAFDRVVSQGSRWQVVGMVSLSTIPPAVIHLPAEPAGKRLSQAASGTRSWDTYRSLESTPRKDRNPVGKIGETVSPTKHLRLTDRRETERAAKISITSSRRPPNPKWDIPSRSLDFPRLRRMREFANGTLHEHIGSRQPGSKRPCQRVALRYPRNSLHGSSAYISAHGIAARSRPAQQHLGLQREHHGPTAHPAMISRMRAAKASIANGFVRTAMPGAR